jgi:hypothetical protein
MSDPHKFVVTYRKAGGEWKLEVFKECGHIGLVDRGPQTDRAHHMAKDFTVRESRALQAA